MTIHKSQSQSFESIGIFLTESIFGHGMLYTAISRITYPDKLKFFIIQNDGLQGSVSGYDGTFISNIVYKELINSFC